MDKEQSISKIREVLEKMNCEDILFSDSDANTIIVVFNCKEITSFVANINGWTYKGIQLDPTKQRQYKINFDRIDENV